MVDTALQTLRLIKFICSKGSSEYKRSMAKQASEIRCALCTACFVCGSDAYPHCLVCKPDGCVQGLKPAACLLNLAAPHVQVPDLFQGRARSLQGRCAQPEGARHGEGGSGRSVCSGGPEFCAIQCSSAGEKHSMDVLYMDAGYRTNVRSPIAAKQFVISLPLARA